MDKNSAKGKGFRTAYQALAGTLIGFVTGIFALPEVQLYVSTFVREQGIGLVITLLGMIGVSSGFVAFIQNKFGK